MGRTKTSRYQAWLGATRDSGNDLALIRLVKATHTVIFLVLLACVVEITVACFLDRFGRRSRIALGAVVIEGAIFGLNRRRCPLTVLVEDLGEEHGQVTDIFLPDAIAKNIFTISMTMLSSGAIALALRRLVRPQRLNP
jgi:hypothetical protein